MSSDIERAQTSAPSALPSREIFYVSSDGETTGEIEHLQQVKLQIEQLSDSSPSVTLDMRKISADGWSGLSGIQVMLLDFGIPPRSVTVSGDFRTSAEVSAMAYDSENESSPNTLSVSVSRTEGDEHTYNFDDKYSDYDGFSLRRGGSVFIMHDGESISTRTGFLGDIDLAGVSEYGMFRDYEEILKLSYEGHELTIETLNHSQALVAHGKSIGYAERHAAVEEIPEEVKALIGGIEDEATQKAVLGLHTRLTKLAVEHEATLGEVETIEAILEHNKGLLRNEKNTVWQLRSEVERLKARADTHDTREAPDWVKNLMGDRTGGGKSELEQHCETIGLSPALAATEPELVVAAAKSMRKVWAKRLHPDVSAEDGEALKEINAAVDAIVERFN